jgi:hypothetical protein
VGHAGVIYETFKNGILNALPVVETGFGYFSEAFSSGGGFGVYVVADEDEHEFSFFTTENTKFTAFLLGGERCFSPKEG